MQNESIKIKKAIESGKTTLGIELGSTRIKAVLIGANNQPIASGNHDWENSYINQIWTYSLDDIWTGLQNCYASLVKDVQEKYDTEINQIASIGLSGMMHGYLVFDKDGNLLTPFRTWRNNTTERASKELSKYFHYPIPQRWGISHLYQAILNNEEHVSKIAFMTTLSGYLHWQMTGRKVLGVGEASGAFPIDIETKQFDIHMFESFDKLIMEKKYNWKISEIMPDVYTAGMTAGTLTEEGAKKLDTSGKLKSGIPFCPPEGDAGTGMVATNSVSKRTGNVSAGTSVFAMIVLEKKLSKVYSEIDLVTTPDGSLVAMAHSNNCTSDLDAWLSLFSQSFELMGEKITTSELYAKLLPEAMNGDADCGGLLSYGYISGEHVTGFEEGRPLFVRLPNSNFTLANFIRTHLFSALGAMRTGLNILFEQESVRVDEIRGHGGFFKTKDVGQKIMAAVTNTPVSVMETAGEGGAWGIALLSSYMLNKEANESLTDFLNKWVFNNSISYTIDPNPNDVEGYNKFFELYHNGLKVERAAVEALKS